MKKIMLAPMFFGILGIFICTGGASNAVDPYDVGGSWKDSCFNPYLSNSILGARCRKGDAQQLKFSTLDLSKQSPDIIHHPEKLKDLNVLNCNGSLRRDSCEN